MGSHLESRDRGAAGLVKHLKELSEQGREIGNTLRVGILEKGGDAEGHTTVVQIAMVHEFGAEIPKKDGGTIKIPERSFIRGWADQYSTQIRDAIRFMAGKVARRELTLPEGFGQLGSLFVGEIQRRIVDQIPPPLADATVQRKGSSTPLVDTGQLKSSITFDVVSE